VAKQMKAPAQLT